jgi:hypothetical protein
MLSAGRSVVSLCPSEKPNSGTPSLIVTPYGVSNSVEGVRAYEETKQEEICASGEQSTNNTSGRVEKKSTTTCGKTMRQLGRIFGLVASFFRLPDSAPIDPVRSFILSNRNFPNFPRVAAPTVPVCVFPRRVPAPPSMDEIFAKTICNLARTKYIALWNVSYKTFVLFQDPITKSSLTLPLDNNFCAQTMRAHLRKSRATFGIVDEDL